MTAADVTVPLSPTQRRLWTLAQLRPGDPFFNHPFAVDLTGPLDVTALCRALGELVRRHPALRIRIERVGGELAQVEHAAEAVELEPADLTGLDPAAAGERLDELTDEHAQRPFDVEGGPLLRMLLVRVADDVHRLVVNVHHIVFDGVSLELFLTQLAALYDVLAAGQPAPAAAPDADYAAFVRRRAERDEQAAEANLEYWSRRLAGAPEVLELPTGGPRSARAGHEAARHTLLIPPEVLTPLRELARRTRATPYLVLKSACDVLLSRYGTPDVLTGMALSGRDTTDSAGVIGYLARPVVLRTDLAADPAFTDVVKAVRGDVLDAHDHPDLPFEDVLRAVGGERDVSYHPLYQVMFDHHVPLPEREAGGVRFAPRELRLASMKVDLNIGLVETDAGLRAELDYRAALFEPEAIAAMAAELETLLRRIGERPDARVSELCAALTACRTEAAGDPDPGECPHRLVERQAAATPAASAVTVGERSWSYRELDSAADAIAARLREHGAGRGHRVGVCTPRPPELPGAILGVLKSGAACVPLDPALPAYLLRAVADDAEVDMVVADPFSASLFDRTHTTVLELADDWIGRVSADPADPADSASVGTRAEPGDVAFVVPTSGSTGEPVLVEVEHRNLGHTLGWLRRELPGAFGSVPPLEPAGSIGGLIALFAPLVTGGTVAPGVRAHTALCVTPPALAELLDTGAVPASVRTVLTHGAPLPVPLADRLHRAGAERLYHLYGSAEAGGFALGERVMPGAAATLGRPIGDARVSLVDGAGGPGAVGELYLGGSAVARGYLGEPERTARRFPLDPESGQRLHATGDLAYRRADGRLVFAGRAAERHIRPADIEAALLAHPAVKAAAVTGDERPHAAVVAWAGTHVGEAELTAHLAERLPRYLQPAAVTVLGALPALPGGKPDRRRLARLLADAAAPASTGPEPPQGQLETVVAGAWSEVLGRSVGAGDNFFDVGGNSLLLVRLRDRLRTALGTQVQLVDLFRHSTVRAMAAHLAGGPTTEGEDAAQRGSARKDALRARGRARSRPQ